MAKVTMYRGIDPTDGVESMFAVCNGAYACKCSGGSWETPEGFEDFTLWASRPLENCPFEIGMEAGMVVVWEVDL